jgi:hypothetical protein
MSISINSKMSGFRKWAEAQSQNNDGRTGATDNRNTAVADPDARGKTAEQRPHRPWSSPGLASSSGMHTVSAAAIEREGKR